LDDSRGKDKDNFLIDKGFVEKTVFRPPLFLPIFFPQKPALSGKFYTFVS
jgi:hypothetical protein